MFSDVNIKFYPGKWQIIKETYHLDISIDWSVEQEVDSIAMIQELCTSQARDTKESRI